MLFETYFNVKHTCGEALVVEEAVHGSTLACLADETTQNSGRAHSVKLYFKIQG